LKRHQHLRLMLPLVACFLLACSLFQREATTEAQQNEQATGVAQSIAATLTAQAAPAQASISSITPTPQSQTALSAAEIFARISPSVAYIETPTGTGSGVFIEEGYLLTNAHVLWPFESVRLVFPNGTEFIDAPVFKTDLMVDLALIGPLETGIPALSLADGEALPVGSSAYLIGYPGEVEAFPQPAIAGGLISRIRQWPAADITYFQTDAAIAGGQSGGVLVSDSGQVIGLSGFFFAEMGFALSASSADLSGRVARLIQGDDMSGLGERHISTSGGQREQTIILSNVWDTAGYVLDAPPGSDVEITVDSEADIEFMVADAFGDNILATDDIDGVGAESGAFTTELEAPYFLFVRHFEPDDQALQIFSNYGLAPYQDVDDGTEVAIGETVAASIDYPGDIDYFILNLDAGETVEVVVDSVMIDPFLTLDYPEATIDDILSNDDDGGGLFGLNAALTFTAPQRESYFLIVDDSPGRDFGGYFLVVRRVE